MNCFPILALAQLYPLDCRALICGFSPEDEPYILELQPGKLAANAVRNGFKCIGSGAALANLRLGSSETKRVHPLERVLYDVASAKFEAEADVGVGYEWDAKIIVAGKPEPVDVPKDIKDIIERVHAKYNRSPSEWNQYDKETDLRPPPSRWKDSLRDYAESLSDHLN